MSAYNGPFGALTQDAANALLSAGTSALASLFRNVYYLDPANGYDGNTGLSQGQAFKTLATAYGACTAGQNDAVVLMANGGTSATARSDASFTWAKSETHLIGNAAPVLFSQRARIAPNSSTAAFTPYFTVSASGCIFQNIQWFMGFTAGTTAQVGMVVTGSRNYFQNCQIAGMCDADHASGADAGSRVLKIGSGGSGENVFDSCVIGADTEVRSAANATIEFAGGTTRNVFRDCLIPMDASANSPFAILGTGASCVDRFNYFIRCTFTNAIKSGGTGITALGSFTSASPGGAIVFQGCATVGATKFGDTNFLANSYVDMAAVSGSAGGLMVVPS
jgi:hypothetical protein